MKKKLQLNELEVTSFVTATKSEQIQGGQQTLVCITPVIRSVDVDCPVITRVRDLCLTVVISGSTCNAYTEQVCIDTQLITNCGC